MDTSFKKKEIKEQIEQTRDQINETVQELQDKFGEIGVQQQISRHPWRALGISFGVGILVSGMVNGLVRDVGRSLRGSMMTAFSAMIVGAISKRLATAPPVQRRMEPHPLEM